MSLAGASTVLVVGDVVDDVLVRARGPATRGSDTVAEIVSRPGGSAANVACWVARAGGTARFVGRVGAGDVGRHAAALTMHGVQPVLAADQDRPTATIVLLVDTEGERTMYVDRGANAGLALADVGAARWHDVGWLHLTGYSFFDPGVRAVARALVDEAHDRGIGVSVDPSSTAFLRECGPDVFLDWVSGVELLLPNLDEARLLAGRDDPDAAARGLLEHAAEVVITCGRDGAVRIGRDGDPVWTEAVPADVVDTTGAGDAFCGGLLATRTAGAAIADQLAAGTRLAAEAVSRLGARPPLTGNMHP